MIYCDRCQRYLSSHRALWQHEEDSNRHFVCRSCDRGFTSFASLKSHWINSSWHNYCEWCSEDFDSAEELGDHNDEEHFTCGPCGMIFRTATAFHEHNLEEHWYCSSCQRVFRSKSNLDSHLNSSLHKPKNIICPGANCGKGFVSYSALMLHFESGTCASGLTRNKLNDMVVRMDRNNILTNPAKLITGPDGVVPATTTRSWATERSYNGYAYECFLCHRTFHALGALNAHLQSPRHQERIYRCPNTNTCGTKYSVLSALTQHVESGKCGVNRFRQMRDVQSALDSLTSGVHRLGFS